MKNDLMDLRRIISNGKKIYSGLFNAKLFLGQLVYTKDLNTEDAKNTNLIGKGVAITDVEDFFKVKILEVEGIISGERSTG